MDRLKGKVAVITGGNSGLEISVETAKASPPAALISAATFVRAASLRAVMTTTAPSFPNRRIPKGSWSWS